MTTQNCGMIQTNKSKIAEVGRKSDFTRGGNLPEGELPEGDSGRDNIGNQAKSSEADLADRATLSKDGITVPGATAKPLPVSGTPGFRMKLHLPPQQHARKRKRPANQQAQSSSVSTAVASSPSSNVFGDEDDDDDDTRKPRAHKLLTMTLSGSSSSSDEEDCSSRSMNHRMKALMLSQPLIVILKVGDLSTSLSFKITTQTIRFITTTIILPAKAMHMMKRLL